jgi:hypothetical protein
LKTARMTSKAVFEVAGKVSLFSSVNHFVGESVLLPFAVYLSHHWRREICFCAGDTDSFLILWFLILAFIDLLLLIHWVYVPFQNTVVKDCPAFYTSFKMSLRPTAQTVEISIKVPVDFALENRKESRQDSLIQVKHLYFCERNVTHVSCAPYTAFWTDVSFHLRGIPFSTKDFHEESKTWEGWSESVIVITALRAE